VSEVPANVSGVARAKTLFTCSACGQQVAQWVGRCPGCDGWGTIEQVSSIRREPGTTAPMPLRDAPADHHRISSGFEGLDRALGGGILPASVSLLAGEPGIGKSTLLLHVLAHLSSAGHSCLLVSGEESLAQVAARARRLQIVGDAIAFGPGRDLEGVLDAARALRPSVLAVDSIQTLRDSSGTQMPGGVSQVRACTDALVGLAKADGIAVLLTGHVTKDGDLAGPRALEHGVDVVLTFDGDPRSGLRVLAGGKNRFGPEGETAWFEMGARGLTEVDPSDLLLSGERVAGAAVALPRSGRRALAVEVQALIGPTDGPARRQVTGLDPRRFQLVAAVLDRAMGGLRLGRAELFGAASGGIRLEDPACDLAMAAALVSAATGTVVPEGSAFVGEMALTGVVRTASSLPGRLAAARAAGCTTAFAAVREPIEVPGVRVVPVRRVTDALDWARSGRQVQGSRPRSSERLTFPN
jgi:DNA repair protein RadA/Sms